MVADKVTLRDPHARARTRARAGSRAARAPTPIETVDDAPQGTSVTLHLKPEDAEDQPARLHVDAWKIREIVKRYSDFITWPIRMARGERRGGRPTSRETETLNSMKALWARPQDEVTDEEYTEFYKHISHDWNDPLEIIRMQAEGTFEYQALLFIPSHAPHRPVHARRASAACSST